MGGEAFASSELTLWWIPSGAKRSFYLILDFLPYQFAIFHSHPQWPLLTLYCLGSAPLECWPLISSWEIYYQDVPWWAIINQTNLQQFTKKFPSWLFNWCLKDLCILLKYKLWKTLESRCADQIRWLKRWLSFIYEQHPSCDDAFGSPIKCYVIIKLCSEAKFSLTSSPWIY